MEGKRSSCSFGMHGRGHSGGKHSSADNLLPVKVPWSQYLWAPDFLCSKKSVRLPSQWEHYYSLNTAVLKSRVWQRVPCCDAGCNLCGAAATAGMFRIFALRTPGWLIQVAWPQSVLRRFWIFPQVPSKSLANHVNGERWLLLVGAFACAPVSGHVFPIV